MTIRVYTGIGTARNGAPLLVEELSKHLDIDVRGINHDEMRHSQKWKTETSTLIFAGQSVRQFKKALGEKTLTDIHDLVKEGAFNYIGICAGACFASTYINYRVVDSPERGEEKIKNIGLGFFNGLATGPSEHVSPLPFSGSSENLHLIQLRSLTDLRSFNAFHWGGPTLIPSQLVGYNERRTLSILEGEKAIPMSFNLKYGHGNVSLYSYHPEINADNVGRWAETRYMADTREAERIANLSGQLDGTAFKRFLQETNLKPALQSIPQFSNTPALI